MSKFTLSRRRLLMGAVGGISVQIGLPALSAMLNSHGTALAQGGALPKRFLVWFWANGMKPARWVPSNVGPDWALSEQLTPLKNVKEYVSVVSGTEIKFPNATGLGCRSPATPNSISLGDDIAGYAASNRAMSDLTALVLACDISRAITYQYSGGSNNSSYPSLTGVTTDNHELNHSEPDPQPLSNKITIFTMEQLAYFLEILKATPEGSGNLLDQCGIFCTSELSDGNTHAIDDYPILIAGRAGGTLKHPSIHYRSTTNENALMPALSLLRAVGLPLTSYGDGVGTVTTGIAAIEA